MKYYFYIFLSFLFFSSCAVKKDSESNNTSANEFFGEEILKDTVVNIHDYSKKNFHPSKTLECDLIHTKLELLPNWQTSTMNGKATITLKAHFYSVDSVCLDAKNMKIYSVKLNDKELKYSYDSLNIHILLDREYTRFENFTLEINYLSQPEGRNVKSGQAITSDKGLFFINPKGDDTSKMPQIWTQGETESNSVWFPTIDSPNAKTTQEIFITVDDKYVTLSNGKLVSSIKNKDGSRTDHWKQMLPHAPYLFMIAVGEFKIVKDYYTRSDGSKMEVFYYVENEWENEAKKIFGETPKMIDFFSKLTGVEYPWDKYHQIVVRDYVSGAMENTGAVVFGDFVYKTSRELIEDNDQSTIAHELFHHWFGDLVTCESWSNLSLNESFANYSQYLWDEYRYGQDEADYQAENEKQAYFNQISYSEPHPLIWYDYEDKEQMFDQHTYNKGGRILHLLRKTIGDSAFFVGLKLYLKNNQYKSAEYHNLRLSFEEVLGEDLNWFFKQWYEQSGHPKLEIDQYYSVNNKEVVLTIYQKQDLSKTPLYKIPTKVSIEDDSGLKIYPITISKDENKYVFPVIGKLKNLCFDVDKAILGEIIENKPIEQYIHEFYNSKKYISRKISLIEATKSNLQSAKNLVFDALNDPFWEIRKTAIENISVLDDSFSLKLNQKLISIAKNDESSKVRNEALLSLYKKIPDNELIKLINDRFSIDSSFVVIGTCLELLSELDLQQAIEKAKILENENSNRLKVKIAQIYASKGSEKNFSFFKDLFKENKFSYYDGIIILNSFSIYLSKQLPEIQMNAMSIYKDISLKGSTLMKTFLSQNISFIISQGEEKIKEVKASLDRAEKNRNKNEIELYKTLLEEYELLVKKWTDFFYEFEESKKIKK